MAQGKAVTLIGPVNGTAMAGTVGTGADILCGWVEAGWRPRGGATRHM